MSKIDRGGFVVPKDTEYEPNTQQRVLNCLNSDLAELDVSDLQNTKLFLTEDSKRALMTLAGNETYINNWINSEQKINELGELIMKYEREIQAYNSIIKEACRLYADKDREGLHGQFCLFNEILKDQER